jgi:YggT family protein
MSLDLFFYAILIQAILSWVNPNTPIRRIDMHSRSPILAPYPERWIPPVNGIDFSALVAMILLQMVNIAFISYAATIAKCSFLVKTNNLHDLMMCVDLVVLYNDM